MYVGKLAIPDGIVDITDPCYKRGTWCAMWEKHIKPGTYDCYVERHIFEDDGYGEDERVAKIAIHLPEVETGVTVARYLDTIGVDAGLAGFFIKKQDYSDAEWESFCDDIYDISEGDHWLRDDAFFSISGFGDGGYPVWALINEQGETVGLEIEFINPEEF